MPHNKQDLEKRFLEKCPKYERLAKNLYEVLKEFLKEKNIENLGVFYRIKNFESFWQKIEKKNMKILLKM